jgi:hypothetical protein
MFQIKAIMQTANKATEEILDGKGLTITQLNRLIYVAATAITEEINGTGEYKLEAQRSKTPPWVRHIQESRNDIRRKLSTLVEIKRDNRKVQNVKRTRLLKKYNPEKKENLDQMIEELKQRFQQRRNCYLDTGKDKTSIIKTSCLGKTSRNFITVSGRHIPV